MFNLIDYALGKNNGGGSGGSGGSAGGGNKTFTVNFSYDDSNNLTADKTIDEVIAAAKAGDIVRGAMYGWMFYLSFTQDDEPPFNPAKVQFIHNFYDDAVYGDTLEVIDWDTDNGISSVRYTMKKNANS